MPLWTLFGWRKGKATTAWPKRGDRWAGRRARHAALRSEHCREVARPAPPSARPKRSRRTTAAASGSRSITGAASSASSASRPARPARWRLPFDWAFGVARARRSALGEARRRTATPRRDPARLSVAACISAMSTPAPAMAAKSELQALNNPFYNLHRLRHLLHAVAALRRSAAGHRPRHQCDGGAAARAYEAMPRAPLGDGGRHLRRVGRHRRRRLCLRQRPRRRLAGRSLSARLPAQPRGDHRGAADVPRSRAATGAREAALPTDLLAAAALLWIAGGILALTGASAALVADPARPGRAGGFAAVAFSTLPGGTAIRTLPCAWPATSVASACRPRRCG